jgi:hypothetical protein
VRQAHDPGADDHQVGVGGAGGGGVAGGLHGANADLRWQAWSSQIDACTNKFTWRFHGRADWFAGLLRLFAEGRRYLSNQVVRWFS